MDPFETYRKLNARLSGGETLRIRGSGSSWETAAAPRSGLRKVFYPGIGIYAGGGTSHSWLWFVDLCERAGLYDVVILDEGDVQRGALEKVDVLVVSGGDTFAVAHALGAAGAEGLQRFVRRGGIYIGSCAGAYLPMNSSKEPLNRFNFAPVRIANRSRTLPKAARLSHKFSMAYGCDYIFHPVRETVKIRTHGIPPFIRQEALDAPLYGGPSMIAPDGCEVLASYEDFTAQTLYLTDPSLAAETMIGKAAAVHVPSGNGCLYLYGPHLEHPRFPQANRLVLDSIYWSLDSRKPSWPAADKRRRRGQAPAGAFILDLKRELSNSRIAANGMDLFPILWPIGSKVYEPEKIRVFLEAMWRRIKKLEESETVSADGTVRESALDLARKTTQHLRQLKTALDERKESAALAEDVLHVLRKLSIVFFSMCFRTASGCFSSDSSGAPALPDPIRMNP
jgi:hypothetical protein